MNSIVFGWLIVTILGVVAWIGVIGAIAAIVSIFTKEQRVFKYLWRIGMVIAAIPCVLWLGIFAILGVKSLYTFSDRQAIRQTYHQIVQAVENRQYATAYALLCPAYQARYSLQEIQRSSRLEWVRDDHERRTPRVEWNKTVGSLPPVDETGLVLFFEKRNDKWCMKEETVYWLD